MQANVKRSVTVLIRRGDRFLSTRRPDDDDELPGIWGLPAGSYRAAESLDDLVARIGRDKLAVELTPIRRLGHRRQQRERYVLDMELWEAEMSGSPHHPAWQWATPDILESGMSQGSLCCQLALEHLKS
jgi:ADP-ribose pyrophosphatase YjhB (NUDIX family)